MTKKIALIGSTGSIGRQVLSIVKENPWLSVVSLTAHTNRELLEEQIIEYNPRVACLTGCDQPPAAPKGVEVYSGADSIERAVTADADIVFVAVTGFCGLRAVLAAIEAGKTVALANKEALVCGGEIVMAKAKAKGVEIIPVDSEHSAVWQALGFKRQGFKRLILTASGGPFRQAKTCEMRHFTAKDALAHPNWSMGEKITVDCATMLNKGFEVIEAHHLFSAPASSIEVVVHPQSIIHSMVEFDDNSVMAEMSVPDMRQPIQLALTYPERLPLNIPTLDLVKLSRLEFFPLDRVKFPCFDLALSALSTGANAPTALNAASEVAVNAFLKDRLGFTDIARVIEEVLNKTERTEMTYAALEYTDAVSRRLAMQAADRLGK